MITTQKNRDVIGSNTGLHGRIGTLCDRSDSGCVMRICKRCVSICQGGNLDVPDILDGIPESAEAFAESCIADRTRAHIDATPILPNVHR
jgi:hypothetical protein